MNQIQSTPGEILANLLTILNDIRRESIITPTHSAQLKKIYSLTIRQGEAIGRVRMLMEENPEGVSLKTLAQHLQMTVPATSLLVEALVGKGFLERNPNPDDRRAICIRLSAKGIEFCSVCQSAFIQRLEHYTSVITPEEIEVLRNVNHKLMSKQ